MNSHLWIPSALLMSLAGAVPAVAGSIRIDATPFSDASSAHVDLDIAITDNGELPDVASFGIRRRATYPCSSWTWIACIARQPGTRTVHIVDNPVSRNTTYEYEAVANCVIPYSNPTAFQFAFHWSTWPFPILEFVTVGPDPTPVTHGPLSSSSDAGSTFVLWSTCSDACLLGGGIGDASVNSYVDTGTDVFLYGTVEYCCNCCGYLVYATAAVPRACDAPIAVDGRTWTNVKRLYD